MTLAPRIARIALVAYAVAQIGFLLFLFVNHAPVPFNLEAMESAILQHVRLLMAGQFVYADPSPRFAALAYTPLYYIVSVPFVWAFGSNLLALRVASIAATIGSGVLIYRIVRGATRSSAWALLAAGLFAAAYRVMDTYLDTAHADAWLVFSILLGCHLIDGSRSPRRNIAGVAVLVAAFWFKQHGALFAVGAVVFLAGRDGWRRAWPAGLIAAVLGPGLYLLASAWLGPRFVFYTWFEPRRWMSLDGDALGRLVEFIAVTYPALCLLGLGGMVAALRRRRLSIWYAMLPVALASGVLGAMDGGSNDNVFIPMGVWFIVSGVIALKELVDRFALAGRWGADVAALGLSFALFAYDPGSVIVPARSRETYRDLVTFVRSLDGPVYAPMIGPLESGNPFYPTLHWVALEDMIRGPGIVESDHPLAHRLLAPVLHPEGSAYILTDSPLETDLMLAFLARNYPLATDLGDRFATLGGLPRRIEIGGPRYLYRFRATPDSSAAADSSISRSGAGDAPSQRGRP